MTKSEYFQFAEQFFNDCVEISRKKNADYTGGSDDPFSNFTSIEILGIKTEHGFLTRMFDKMKRISSFVQNGQLQVKDESVLDTLQDLANYSCLFAGFIKSRQSSENTPQITESISSDSKDVKLFTAFKTIDGRITLDSDRFEQGDTLLIEEPYGSPANSIGCEIEITKKLRTEYGGTDYDYKVNDEWGIQDYTWISGTIVKELI